MENFPRTKTFKKRLRPPSVRPRKATIEKSLCEANINQANQIKVKIKWKTYNLEGMIDSGAQASYISPSTAEKLQIPWRYKLQSYKLRTVDGSLMKYEKGRVVRETEELTVAIQGHLEQLVLDIADINQHDIILGMNWLKRSNPQINWNTHQLSWPKKAPPDGKDICYMIQESKPDQPDGKVPPEYGHFKKLFRDRTKKELPEHNQWDHRIPIKEGHHPKLHQIYHMNPEKARALWKGIQHDLERGYIQESTSSAGYPVLMVPKMKDGKQRIDEDGDPVYRRCVDYRQLNDITIKNGYPLTLMTTMKENVSQAQWFTALDLRDGYHLIRISQRRRMENSLQNNARTL